MKKIMLIALLLGAPTCKTYIQPSTAHADWDCGRPVCYTAAYCGKPKLPDVRQMCHEPVPARYCEVKVCQKTSSGTHTYRRWTWRLLKGVV